MQLQLFSKVKKKRHHCDDVYIAVFKRAYTHLVLPWSTIPEIGDSQSLHLALLTEFNLVMDEIIYKAKEMDLSVTALGCIQILTKHLHNTKQPEG